MYRIRSVATLFALLLIYSCKNATPIKEESIVFRDYFGRTITVDTNIERILPIYYVQAEILCAIGAKDNIVGIGKIERSSSLIINDHFPELLDLTQVGQSNLSYEKIVALSPDAILAGTNLAVNERLESLGYLTISTYPKTLNDVLDVILLYGDILGKEKEAVELHEYFESLLDRIRKISSSIPPINRPTVYYIRTDALTSLGGNILGEIFSLAGGDLVTKEVGDNSMSLIMSFEDIYKYDPDVIVIRDRASVKPADIYSDERWKNINAVKKQQIFQEHFGWTEFRLETIFGIIEKAKWLHPHLFDSVDTDVEYAKFIEMIMSNN